MTTERLIGSGLAWDVAANWSGGSVPQPGDDVAIPGSNASSSNLVDIAASDPGYTIGSLSVDAGYPNYLAFEPGLVDDGSLTVAGATNVGNGGRIVVDGNASLNLLGVTTLSIGNGSGSVANITVGNVNAGSPGAGKLTIGTLSGNNGGSLVVANGTASIAADNSTSGIEVDALGRVTVGHFGSSDGTFSLFAFYGGTLAIGDVGADFMGNVEFFDLRTGGHTGGAIDATALPYQAGETVRVTQQTLSLGPYGNGYIDSCAILSPQGQTLFTIGNVKIYSLSGSASDSAIPLITLGSDSAGGTLISVACYTPKTLIQTPVGEKPAGDLRIGDEVTTLGGTAKPIVWIGRRSYSGRFLAQQPHLLPVRIQAGALGGGLPRRDLFISPCHAMFLDGVLVPASSLVNGTTIRQETHAERVDYVHIELAEHDVIFAEGAPSETFLDDDSRNAFHNASEYAALYSDWPAPEPNYYAPRLTDGFDVEAIRDRLAPVGQDRKAA